MAEMLSGDYRTLDLTADRVLAKPTAKESAKDSKNKHKLEARRRIDDLLEQKRLRQLLDLDEDEMLDLADC